MKTITILLFCALVGADELFHIPLAREKGVMEQMLEANTPPKYLKKIFGKSKLSSTLSASTPKPITNDTVPLFKFLQSYYYGEILIGSPGQKFKIVFDTAFLHSWVPSALCSPFVTPACAFRNKYDSSKSTTFVPVNFPVTLLTDKGTLTGFLQIDKIHLGHLSVMNQTFVEIEKMSLKQLIYSGYDGVFGMGFDNDPNDLYVPFFKNLVKQYPNIKQVFSFFINRDETTPKGGSLFLGGSNPKYYNGSFTYLSVKDKRYWGFRMDKIIVNFILPYRNKTLELCSEGCDAYPTIADVLIYGPEDEVKELNRILGAQYVPFLDRYEIPCSKIHKLPAVTFVLGGNYFKISGKDYVQKLTYGPAILCLSAFTGVKGSPKDIPWGLGLSFFGPNYVEFNMEKETIGIVKSIVSY